jgi:DNA repair exonuclease SbcCD nuclease subunit
MQEYRFIAWADTHWDKFGAKCITLEDTDVVERAVFKRAQETNVDFTLFAGDRFLKREPDDETKVRADRVFYDLVHPGTIPHYHLVGNHDWVDNARSWHTSESLKLFNNVNIMDTARTYTFRDVRIHALPADIHLDLSCYTIDPKYLNIFVFHAPVRGSYLSDDKTSFIDSGVPLSEIDLPQFDFVLAGDIHVRQAFPLKNRRGGYLGSVVQRTRADSNVLRGYTEITASRESYTKPWKFKTRFVPTRNFFTRLGFAVDSSTVFENFKFHPEQFTDQLVEVKLSGDKNDVDRVAEDLGWRKLEKEFSMRRLEIIRDYEIQQSETVVDLSSSNGFMDDLELYLGSKFSSLGNIPQEKIIEAVRSIKGE